MHREQASRLRYRGVSQKKDSNALNFEPFMNQSMRFLSRAHDHLPGDDPFFLEHHNMTRLYYANDLAALYFHPYKQLSKLALNLVDNPYLLYSKTRLGKFTAAQAEINSRITHSYEKPRFGIDNITDSDGNRHIITENIVATLPFCNLIRFSRSQVSLRKKGADQKPVPKVLIVAPYSGHFATLLRDTVMAMLQDHDVYITDWSNARDIELHHGEFRLEDYINYLHKFTLCIKDDLHLMAVCQPAVPVMALATHLEQNSISHNIRSMILMGGPIDTRVNPTFVNRLAREKSLDWFDQHAVAYAPLYYQGALRRVIPGFLMLAGFMSLNLTIHASAPHKLFSKLIQGDQDGAEAHRKFYNEYRSVLDLPADYYLDSVYHAFQEHSLPRGRFVYKEEKLDPKSIKNIALMTVEGERDNISGVGQTYAAHILCKTLTADQRTHHLQSGVGHYGVFNGSRWRTDIMPKIAHFIKRHQP